MMTLFNMLMSLIIVLAILQVLKFFIIRTFLGKSLILTFKIGKSFCKYIYLNIKKIYILINKKIVKMEKQQAKKSSKKEVISESKKVVNLDTYRNKK